jgi:D-hydroxyproline dehydrogenase subunit gamma
MLTRSDPGSLTFSYEGQAVHACAGDSIATALLAAGIHVTRTTPVSGAPRGPYCMMGACYECLAVVDGKSSVQTCMTEVKDGMQVERQLGARGLAMDAGVMEA